MSEFIDDTYKRVEEVIMYKKLKIKSFEDVIGVSNNSIGTSIRRKASFKSNVLNKILNSFPEINPTWLLTGKEEMLKKDQIKNLLSESPLEYQRADGVIKDKLIRLLSDDAEVGEVLINKISEFLKASN